MEKINDLTGQKFGMLKVLNRNGKRWICQCDCGKIVERFQSALLSGHDKSCGCQKNKGY